MRKLLISALLFFSVSRLTCAAQPAFQPDQQYTNELRNVRARLNGQPSKFTPAELNRLAETLARSNRLAAVIVAAIARNDFTNAAALLKEYPGTIDDLREYGQPLLQRVVQEANADKLDFLLEHKASPDAVITPFGEPALMQAIQFRRWDMAVKLVQAGASVTLTNRQGRNAAAMFFEYWYPGISDNDAVTNLVPLMLERGLDPFAASRPGQPGSILEECLNRESNYGGRWGWSSLQPSGSPTMILFGDLLLTNRPSPARRTPLGDTALHVAVRYQRTNAIEFLLTAGFHIDQTNDAGLTPLQSLVGTGANSGYDINSSFGSIFIPVGPMRRIAGQPTPQKTMVDYLLEKGATLDIFSAAGLGRTNELAALLATNVALANARDGYGRTPLHYATLTAPPYATGPFVRMGPQGMRMVVSGPLSSNPPPDVVSLLLKADANPSSATTKAVPQVRYSGVLLPAGTTPLHLAARNANPLLVRSLLTARADVKLTDENGDTALHMAARTSQTNILSLLRNARASLEVTNLAGQTPLRAAVESGLHTSVAYLLDAGASPTNGLGHNTLLHLAAERGSPEMLAVLLAHKLALEARDGSGSTPFHRAVAAKQWNSLAFLRDKRVNFNATDTNGNTGLHLLAAQQDDSVHHAPEEPALVEWQRNQLSKPGWTGRALGWLIKSKVLTPPPPQNWTNTSLTTWLVENGAKINVTNRAGQTPLHVLCGAQWAAWSDGSQSTNRIVALLNAGARLDLADTNGATPLQLAASNASPGLFAFIVKKSGRNVNLPDAQGRTLLHAAVEGARENNDRITALLLAGADPNVVDKQGRTALHLALRSRNDGYDYYRGELVRMLLTNKASANLADTEGRTPLHLAFQTYAEKWDFPVRDILPLLLTNGANPNAADKLGRTPLHLLLSSTNPYVQPFNQMGTALQNPRWDFAARDRDGQAPVHLWAARMNNSWDELENVKRILTNQNLVNLTNFAGDTPLHIGIRANKDHVARALMQIGANPLLKNLRGETALRLAVEKSPAFYDQEVRPPGAQHRFFDSIRLRNETDVNLWLAADPSLVSLTNGSGTTPLMAATDAGNTNVIARLLELGAPLDALSALRLGRMEDFLKLLPAIRAVPGGWLFEAVRFGRLEALQALIAAGGDLQSTDADDNSLLFVAGFYKQPDIAGWLKAQGCRETLSDAVIEGDREKVAAFIAADARCVNSTNRNGRTPLYRAAAAGRTEVAALLIEQGAKVDAVAPGGWTALHAAAARDAVEIGRLLLKAGAPPNAVAQGNMAPLHLAAALGCTSMAELLLQNGADINLIAPQQGGGFRNSPLHWAAHLGKPDMFKLLLARGADLNVLNYQNETPLDLARATARGRHWGFSRPPEVPYKFDRTMHQTATRDAMIKQLEEAAAAYAKP